METQGTAQIQQGKQAVQWLSVKELQGGAIDLNAAWRDLKQSEDGKRYVAFMRALVEPEKRLIPVTSNGSAKTFRVTPEAIREAFSSERLGGVIDPERLSFLKEAGIEVDKDAAYLSSRAVGQLVTLFSNLIPLPGTEGRVFAIGTGSPLTAAAGIQNKGVTGAIIYLRRDPGKGDVAMYFPDTASALRKTFHQSKGENFETVELAKLSVEARKVHEGLRRWGKLADNHQSQLSFDSRQVAVVADAALGRARVSAKRKAAEKLVSAAGLKDSLDRVNPQASASRYQSALTSLRGRALEVGKMAGFNRNDQIVLLERVCQDDSTFEKLAGRLAGHMNRLGTWAAFSNPKLSKEQRQAQAEGWFINVGLGTENLGQIVTRPHLTFRDELEKIRAAFKRAAGEKDLRQAEECLKGLSLVCALADLQRQLNLARFELVQGIKGVPACLAHLQATGDALAKLRSGGMAPEHYFPKAFKTLGLALSNAGRMSQKMYALTEANEEKRLNIVKKALNWVDFERRLVRHEA